MNPIFPYLLLAPLWLYLAVVVSWPFVLSMAAFLFRNKDIRPGKGKHYSRILVLIPAYREDAVILETVQSALNHDFPGQLYSVCVIADGLQPDTLEALRGMDVRVIEARFEQSTKAKALNLALAQYAPGQFDIAVVLDADNHMQQGFLREINRTIRSGYLAVQGRRAPKNENTSIAVLDGISEEANNHIYGMGQFALGCSSRLSGSGMGFEFRLFRDAMARVHAINGFDKELELLLTRAGVQIAYNGKAVILDEKVRSSDSFQRQRTRWLAAQYHFLRVHLNKLFREGTGLRKRDYLQKIVILALPPRLLTPMVLMSGLCFGFAFAAPVVQWFFGILLALNILTYVLAIPVKYYKPEYLLKACMLPVAAGQTLLALSRMKRARGKFIHTVHGATENAA